MGDISNAKLPESTAKIIGAEKALFRALKTKGTAPKYGLIFSRSLGKTIRFKKIDEIEANFLMGFDQIFIDD